MTISTLCTWVQRFSHKNRFGIWASRQRFRPGGWDLVNRARIQVSRMGFWSWDLDLKAGAGFWRGGWDLGLRTEIWALGRTEKEKKSTILHACESIDHQPLWVLCQKGGGNGSPHVWKRRCPKSQDQLSTFCIINEWKSFIRSWFSKKFPMITKTILI